MRDPRVDPQPGDMLRMSNGYVGTIEIRATRKPGERIPHIGTAKEYVIYRSEVWMGVRFYSSLSKFRKNAEQAEVILVAC